MTSAKGGNREKVREIFGARAKTYTESEAHKDRQVLGRVVELCDPQSSWRALDAGTGTGHTALALAPHVARVVGIDLTPEMLDEARALAREKAVMHVDFELADVHDLPFDDAAFDLVVCRRAAHHFSDIELALREMIRVLKPGGRMVIDDRSVPEDDDVDRIMHELDRLHDPSHVRQYRPTAWRWFLERVGLTVDVVEPYMKHRPIDSLTGRVDAATARRIHQIFDELSTQERVKLGLAEAHGVRSSDHWYLLIAGNRVRG